MTITLSYLDITGVAGGCTGEVCNAELQFATSSGSR
jgi:hypothetical protein